MASLRERSVRLRSGEVTAKALTEQALAHAQRVDGPLNAWIRLDADGALAQADAVDAAIAAGDELGPLAGVPIGIKDLICTQGLATTAASKMLADFVPPYDATVVRRLRDAGAIILGKLNLDEFAMGSSNETSHFGPVLHPTDPSRVPGGSSGGSAVAVATGSVPVSLGTDTGGSIRQPAAFCGVVGLKPTYGRVSRYGVIAFASSLDQVGPFATNVADVVSVLEVIAGPDPLDATSAPIPVPTGDHAWNRALGRDPRGLRIGVPAEAFGEGVDAVVAQRVRAALAKMEAAGATLVDISLPHLPHAVATYYVIATAEASSNLGRYDGVRYGHRAAGDSRSLHDLIAASRSEGFGAEVKRRILLGTFALSAGYYDAYYGQAQRVRTLIARDFDAAFQRCDVIASPTAPTTAFELGACADDPVAMYRQDLLTIPASLAGLPCLSMPCGAGADGLPVGLQWMAPQMDEFTLVHAASAAETLLSGTPTNGGTV